MAGCIWRERQILRDLVGISQMAKSGLASDLGFLPGMFLISLILRAFPRSAIGDYVWAACGIAWILVVFVVGHIAQTLIFSRCGESGGITTVSFWPEGV